MLKIYIGSSFDPREVIVSPNKNILDIYREHQIPLTDNAVITVNNRRVGDEDLHRPMNELGVETGMLVTYTNKLVGA